MPTRVITSSALASNLDNVDYKGGSTIPFAVSSDTGLNANAAAVSAARLTISSFRSYATTYYLNVLFGNTIVGRTATMSVNESTHSEELALSSLSSALIGNAPTELTLEVVATSGTGNKINFREGCTIKLEVDYIDQTACGAPIVCTLSETISDASVLLSWSGATAGIGNAITGYEVQRCESSDGITWGSWATLATTTAASLSVAPPTTAGNYYKFRVRTMGAAGAAYYSAWKTCASTLRRDHAPLTGFTDETLTAGETFVKAIHMQELQQHVATLRAFYGLSAYAFTPIVAGVTGLAGWTAHVLEIREAVDGISTNHAEWLTITENKPRADVIQQLREVVLAL